jgi:hypothetical protein
MSISHTSLLFLSGRIKHAGCTPPTPVRRHGSTMARLVVSLGATTFAVAALGFVPSAAQASFGISGAGLSFTDAHGNPSMQAGSHPYAVTTTIDLNTKAGPGGGLLPDGEAKDIVASLPAGFVGDPTASSRCSAADFAEIDAEHNFSACPSASAVGSAEVIAAAGEVATLEGGFTRSGPVFNLVPGPGVVAEFGFVVLGAPVVIEIGVNPEPPYQLVAYSTNISQLAEFDAVRLTFWGDPSNSSHDNERGCEGACSVDIPDVPFLTMPTSCAGPLSLSLEADSWEQPGLWTVPVAETNDGLSPPTPLGVTGCESLHFAPTTVAQPTSRAASSPTGFDFDLNVTDEGLTNPKGFSQSDIEKTEVLLPEGMTIDPSQAVGLAACTEAQLQQESPASPPAVGCPEASKVGTIEVETPLLAGEVLDGSLFVAEPYENRAGDSLIALYVVIQDPKLGILIVQPLRVEPDATTGRLLAVAENMPQLPFSHFRLHFREGSRAPLVSPPGCGTYSVASTMYPWSGEPPVSSSSSFQVVSGANGGPCPVAGTPPFSPTVAGGSINAGAGQFTSFYLNIERADSEQEITGFSAALPPGLTGNLTGIPFCTEAEAQHAREQTGAEAEADPACPAASEIGHTIAEAGVGSVLAQTPGKLYLGGPYEGAPFSIVSVTSAKVGPFDLGTVVVHLPLQIDPASAAVMIPAGAADQIPHILKGIVIHVRDIQVFVDRSAFMLNPTSCDRMSLAATVFGSGQSFSNPGDDVPAAITNPFQAVDCTSLKFSPTLAVATSAKGSRNNGQSLSFKIAYPKGALGSQSWFSEAMFTIPKQFPARLTTIQKACAQATYDANRSACPPQSVIGHVVVHTQILPVPLEGSVYFVSHGGEAFPDAVLDLYGDNVHIELSGKTLIKNGVTSATFGNTPDVPFESIEVTLPSGPYSEFGTNLPGGGLDYCGQKLTLPTLLKAQNGLEIKENAPITVNGCPTRVSIHSHKISGKKITLSVYAPASGRLKLSGTGLRSVSRAAKGQELLTFTTRSTRRGKPKSRITVSFTPATGHRQTATLSVRG